MSKNKYVMADSFSLSFNPQRRLRYRYAKYQDEEKARETFLATVTLVTFRLRLKDSTQHRIPKRRVSRRIRKLKGLGFFLAKNMWQFFVFGLQQRVLPDDGHWAETGPGGRVGANFMCGRPANLLQGSTSMDAADFFVEELLVIQKRMRLAKV